MSQELLKALVDVIDDLMLRKKLSEEDALNISDSVLVRAEIAIESYLAQPEQTEQEPVAWKVIDGTNGNYMFSRIKPTERSYKYDVVIPLYIAPPKRESLSDEHLISAAPELLEALSNWINALDDPSEWMKCRDDANKAIEKAHGIGVDDE